MRNKVNFNTLWKRKSRENETPEHCEAHLVKETHEAAAITAAAATIYEVIATTATAATIYEATTAAESKYAKAGSRHFRVARS
ncbi:1692_t:CDS:2, partial [Funneliformis caledonium]